MHDERNIGVKEKCWGVNENFSNSSKKTIIPDMDDKYVSTAVSKVIPLLLFHHLNSVKLHVALELYMITHVRKILTEQSALSRAKNALLLCGLP